MNNDDLLLKMILDESGFTTGLNNAVKKLGDFDNKIDNTSKGGGKSLGGIWTSFVGNFLASGATKIVSAGFNLVKDSVSGAITRFDVLNNSTRVFENMGFSATDSATMIDNLKLSINGLPTPLDSAIQGVQLLASSTGDLGKSEQIFSALNNGILGFGGSTEQVDNAIIQLSQSFSNGKVDAETWNSMINSGLGPALNALAKQMGMTAGELKSGLSDGSVSVKEFQDGLIELNEKGGGGLKSLKQIAADSTDGVKTGIQNMKTAVTRGVTSIVDGIDKALKEADMGGIGQVIADIGSNFEKGLTAIGENIPQIIQFFKDLNDTLEPFKPLIVGVVGAFTAFSVADDIAKKVEGLKTSFDGLSGAFGVIVKYPILFAISAIIGAVIYLWTTNEDFRNAVINIWEGIKDAFSSAADFVVNAWTSVKQFFSDLWTSIKDTATGAVEGVKNAWSDTKQWFSDTWTGIKDGAKGLWDNAKSGAKSAADSVVEAWSNTKQKISDVWTGVKDTAVEFWGSFLDFVLPYIQPLVDGITTAFSTVKEGLSTIFSEVWAIAQNAFEILKNVILTPVLIITSAIDGGFAEVKNNLLGVWNNIREAASEIWGSITTIVSTYFSMLVESVVSIATGWWTSITTIFTGIRDAATQKIREMVESVKAWWSDLVSNVKQFASDMKQSAIQSFQDLKNGAIQRANDLKNSALNAWENLKNGVKQKATDLKNSAINTWENLKNSVIRIANNLKDGAQQAWNNLKNSVSETVDKVKGFFMSLKDIDLFQIGKDIVQGLINGITEKANAVKKKIEDIASTVKNGLKNALNIKSPSRWMRDMIGKNIVLGIVDGITNTTPQLEKTMANLPTEMTDVPSVRVQAQESYQTQVKSAAQTAKESSGNTEVHLHLQVYGNMPDSMINEMAGKLVTKFRDLMDRDAAAVGGIA